MVDERGRPIWTRPSGREARRARGRSRTCTSAWHSVPAGARGHRLPMKPGTQTVALVGPHGRREEHGHRACCYASMTWAPASGPRGRHRRAPVTQASLRRHIGLVPQEPFLFSGAIGDNIRYGGRTPPHEEIEAAARLVERTISSSPCPRIRPSGGRARRRSEPGPAAAGHFRPRGDEGSAHPDPGRGHRSVDTRTEALIQSALAERLVGRTTLVIAHRLSTDQAGRPDPRAAGRSHHGARHPRGVADCRGCLRRPLSASVPGTVEG